SALAVPLVHGVNTRGILCLFTRERRVFTAEEIELLEAFGTQASIALENARLHAAAVRRGEQLDVLLGAARVMIGALDREGLPERIVDEASRLVGTPRVELLLVDREAGQVRLAAVRGGEAPAGFSVPIGQGYLGSVVATGRPLFVPDTQAD